MGSQKPTILAENFDGFVLLRSEASSFSDADIREILKHIRNHLALGIDLVFVDVAAAVHFDHEMFARELAVIKTNHKFDLVFVSSSEMSCGLKGSALSRLVQLYEPRDEGFRRTRTRNVIRQNVESVQAQISKIMESAISAGVQRWIGERPTTVAVVPAEVNPASDVVSLVTMSIDGGEFRFYLSSAHATMRSMASHILKTPVEETDPAISDGACELLNYLTAFFRQKLGDEESVVDAGVPKILPPDEIMSLLDNSPQVRRVQTRYGHFDLWIEAAA